MNSIMSFLLNHSAFSVTVFGSILGTIISFIFPRFTRNYLCANNYFTIGNLGISIFIHNGWGHCLGNLIMLFPIVFICEHLYGNAITLISVFVVALILGLKCIPLRISVCGISGITYMLYSMALMYTIRYSGKVIMLIGPVACAFLLIFMIKDIRRVSVLDHVLGSIAGIIIGLILNL